MKIRQGDIRECRCILKSRLSSGLDQRPRQLMQLEYLRQPVNELTTLLINRLESRTSESALLLGATNQEREHVLYEALHKLHNHFEANEENNDSNLEQINSQDTTEKEGARNDSRVHEENSNGTKVCGRKRKRKRKLKCEPLIVSIDASLHTTDVQALREITWQLTKKTEGHHFKRRMNSKGEIESHHDRSFTINANESCVEPSLGSLANFSKNNRMSGGTLADIDLLMERVRQGKLGSDNPMILILNRFELFAHEKKQLLLYNLVDLLHNSSTHVIIIGVAASFSAKDTLEKRVYSRLFPKMITLKTPDCYEVLDILDELLSLPISTVSLANNTTTRFASSASFLQKNTFAEISQLQVYSSRHAYFRLFNEKWKELRSKQNSDFHDWIGQWFDFHYNSSTFLKIFLTAITHLSVKTPFLTLPLLMKAQTEVIPASFPHPTDELCTGLSENEILLLATLLRMQSRGFVGITLRDIHQEVKRNIYRFSNLGATEATLLTDALGDSGNNKSNNPSYTSTPCESDTIQSSSLNQTEKALVGTNDSSSNNAEGRPNLLINPSEQHTYNLHTFRRSFFRLYGWRGLCFVPRQNINTMSSLYQDFQSAQNLGTLTNIISTVGGIDHLPLLLIQEEELKSYFKSSKCVTHMRRWALNLGD